MNQIRHLFRIKLIKASLIAMFVGLCAAKAQTSMAEYSSTNENHKLLAGLAGSWTFTGKHTFADGHHPIEFTGSMVRTELWDGRYFNSVVTGQDIPMPWSAGKLITLHEIMTEGYDDVKKKFISSYINNEFETGIILLEGTYDADKKTITYDGETQSPPQKNSPPGTMRNFHVLLKLADNNHYTLEWHESVAGKELFDTVLSFTRK